MNSKKKTREGKLKGRQGIARGKERGDGCETVVGSKGREGTREGLNLGRGEGEREREAGRWEMGR